MQDPNKLNIGGSVIKNGEIFSLEVDATSKQPQVKSTTNSGVESITHLPKYNIFELESDTEYPSMGIGQDALINVDPSRSATAFGYKAAENLTSATNNTSVGFRAGYGWTTGNSNTSIGAYAGPYNNTNAGTKNTFVGSTVAAFSTDCSENVGVGSTSLYYLTTGDYNMGMGSGSLQGTTTGSHNVGLGYKAAFQVTTGSENTSIGSDLPALGNTSGTLQIGAGKRTDIFADTNGIVLGDGNLGTEVLSLVVSDYANLNFADDAAAAAGGVALGGLYHTAGAVKIRLT